MSNKKPRSLGDALFNKLCMKHGSYQINEKKNVKELVPATHSEMVELAKSQGFVHEGKGIPSKKDIVAFFYGGLA